MAPGRMPKIEVSLTIVISGVPGKSWSNTAKPAVEMSLGKWRSLKVFSNSPLLLKCLQHKTKLPAKPSVMII